MSTPSKLGYQIYPILMLPFCEVQLREKSRLAQKKEKRRRAIWFVVREKVKPQLHPFLPKPDSSISFSTSHFLYPSLAQHPAVSHFIGCCYRPSPAS